MEELIKIFKIGIEEAEKIAAQPNDPHRHNFEELLIGKAGRLEHFIDFQSEKIDAPFISYIAQGKMHRVRPMPKDGLCDIWGIRFKSELVPQTTFQLYASFHDNANISLQNTACFDRLSLLCKMMYEEYCQPDPDISVLRQLLSVTLVIIESDRKKLNLNDNESNKIKSATFKNFMHLLDEHYKAAEDVQFYAEKLFMTPRNLNNICQSVLNQSVSEIIENRRFTEAKNLLMTTDMNIAEIGYSLGFNEKTYFTHSFKRKTGITPTDFRKEMSKVISE